MKNINLPTIIFVVLVSFLMSSCLENSRSEDMGSWNVSLETHNCECDLELEESDMIANQDDYNEEYDSMIFSDGIRMLIKLNEDESFSGSIENFNKGGFCETNVIIFTKDDKKLEFEAPEKVDAGKKHDFTLLLSNAEMVDND